MPVEAAATLSLPFGFTADQLSARLFIPDARASVRYSRRIGAIERIGRGRYRSRMPIEQAQEAREMFDRVREAALSLPSKFPGALDGATAVFVWTRGGYITGWTDWRVVIEVRSPKRQEHEARRALHELGIGVFADYPPANQLGVFAKLTLASSVRRTDVAGTPVIVRREVDAIIKKNPGVFAGALELIEDADGEVEVLR
ncbi:MAG TPA: hypothetical protein VI893_04140 [Thermoplasmata archaeon]|nr:hypothetical protein [Thermoplasmata archaeon]